MKVSVLMVAYNQDKYVVQAIESVLMQTTDFEWELVIGEDCSTDGTREIVLDYARRHPGKIRASLNERNLGLSANFAKTLPLCRGQYIALLDSDDYWTSPVKLQVQADFLDSHPECSTCFHNVNVVYENSGELPHPFYAARPAHHLSKPTPKAFSTLDDIVEGNFILTLSVMFRAGLFGGFPDWYDRFFFQDWPLYVFNAQRGALGYIPSILGVYRAHPEGTWSMRMSHLRSVEDVKQLIYCYEMIDQHLELVFHRRLIRRLVPLWGKAAQLLYEAGRFSEAAAYARRCLFRISLPRKIERRFLIKAVLRASSPQLFAALRSVRRGLASRPWRSPGASPAPPIEPETPEGASRRELNALRLENQRLHSELNRYLDLRYLSARTVASATHALRRRLRGDGGGFQGSRVASIEGDRAADPRPYRAHILRPVLASRPRVLHAIANFHMGGSAQLVVDLFERVGHRFEQAVITRDFPPRPAYLGIDVDVYDGLTTPRPLAAHLRRFRPDLLHVHFLGHHRNRYSEQDWQWYDFVFAAAHTLGCKVIEGVNIPVVPYVSDAVRRYAYVSDYVRKRYGIAGANGLTIYPGSNFALFTRKGEIPDDCIGMVYRLEKDKLNEQAIDPFLHVVRRRPRTKALIVGGGRYFETYRKQVEAAGLSEAFTFTGYVAYEALRASYEAMSVFVGPVHSEAFGQVIPFAMHMSIPVVGYDVGALGEITDDASMLVPAGDSGALAALIIELLDDRDRRLAIGARYNQRARELFAVETMAERYEKLYDDVLSSP